MKFNEQKSKFFSLKLNRQTMSASTYISAAGAIILIANLFFYAASLCVSLYRIDYSLAPHNFFYRLASMLLPPILWVFATKTNAFKYSNIRIGTFIIAGIYECIFLCGIAYQLLSRLFLPSVMSIKTDDIFTKDMVLILARIARVWLL